MDDSLTSIIKLEEVEVEVLGILLHGHDLQSRVGTGGEKNNRRREQMCSRPTDDPVTRRDSLFDKAGRVSKVGSVGRGHIVIQRGEGAVISADLSASVSQPLERLSRRDFVDEMSVGNVHITLVNTLEQPGAGGVGQAFIARRRFQLACRCKSEWSLRGCRGQCGR